MAKVACAMVNSTVVFFFLFSFGFSTLPFDEPQFILGAQWDGHRTAPFAIVVAGKFGGNKHQPR